MASIKLTDQELNDWVAVNIMGLLKDKHGFFGIPPTDQRIEFEIEFLHFLPSSDFNHTYLMEEKIIEIGRGEEYSEKLDLINFSYGNLSHKLGLTHASARQRCEAAYLTFKEGE